MPINDPKKFVSELILPSETGSDVISLVGSGLQDTSDADVEGYVNNKSLVSFVSNVNGQNRKDVLHSTLLAQRVADKKHPDPINVIDWYETYIDVLTNVGWTIESKDLSNFTSATTIFEMENVVVDIITAMIGQNYAVIIKSTLSAIKGLAEDDGRVKVFESNSHSFQKGNFQIGFVDETNDAISMHIGAFMLDSHEEIRRILFFKGGKDETSLRYYAIKCTLNNEVYSLVRNAILDKLGVSTQSYIGKLEL